MNREELYALLDLPETVTGALNRYGEGRSGSFHISIRDLMENTELVQQLDKLISRQVGDNADGIRILWEELEIAREAFEEYRKKGIPADIFRNTMKFCTRFLLDYHKTYGCYRFVWGWWFPRQLSLREFRIGALEYEFTGESRINIHIPSDADLSRSSVLHSLSQFELFCGKYYPERAGQEMWCSSWLLSPALRDILPEKSNILAFQELFHVTETDDESMAVLDWVFPGFPCVSEELPENTRLQKNMKKYLLEGKKIGWTTGILRSSAYKNEREKNIVC